ncbi:hypothetical protein THAOC_04850 [Thalassiosira oceanica]|uniref:Leucine-rich repeat-containing N-terminal plant-type domain-containing protein n=1 Tax=Thalassiosira oceanica TaxID=159749 RepID=K0T8V4_THAOC|nr:hypothetical protein THAOC_04850 [Thalassiosira oceanica]|eukprot:EJK73524.1 hypothetical protein THAOC_04850 [Thalassiosira oceanica]
MHNTSAAPRGQGAGGRLKAKGPPRTTTPNAGRDKERQSRRKGEEKYLDEELYLKKPASSARLVEIEGVSKGGHRFEMPSSKKRTKDLSGMDVILDGFPSNSSRNSGFQSIANNSGDDDRQKWNRAIDLYVASVLDTSDDENCTRASRTSRSSGSRRTPGNRPPKTSVHPDQYLFDALSVTSNSSVDRNGNVVDDASFEPVNPFGTGPSTVNQKRGGISMFGGGSSGSHRSRMRKVKSYLKEEWKPISLIVLVIAATVVFSAVYGTKEPVEVDSGGDTQQGTSAVVPIEDAVVQVQSVPTDSPTYSPTYSPSETTAVPTYFPTLSPVLSPETTAPVMKAPKWFSEAPVPATPKPTDEPTTQPPSPGPTDTPTLKPTIEPSVTPTASPIMPDEYYEMLRAAKYVSGDGAFDTNLTPQSLAFHWLYHEGQPSTNLYEWIEQYATAVVFFALTQTRNPYSGEVPVDFLERPEVCSWEGIRCAYNYTSAMVHVTEINLSDEGLTGSLPQEVGWLPKLSRLDLSSNNLTGTIPESIYSLTRLSLTGEISPNIDNLNFAEQIFLGDNALSGELPATIGIRRPNNWRFFSVHNNKLTGPIREGMKLRNTYMLDLSKMGFTVQSRAT